MSASFTEYADSPIYRIEVNVLTDGPSWTLRADRHTGRFAGENEVFEVSTDAFHFRGNTFSEADLQNVNNWLRKRRAASLFSDVTSKIRYLEEKVTTFKGYEQLH